MFVCVKELKVKSNFASCELLNNSIHHKQTEFEFKFYSVLNPVNITSNSRYFNFFKANFTGLNNCIISFDWKEKFYSLSLSEMYARFKAIINSGLKCMCH